MAACRRGLQGRLRPQWTTRARITLVAVIGLFFLPPLLPAQDTITVGVELDSAGAQVLDRAQALVQAGDAEAAYTLLAEREVELAGHPLFDYLLGVAALDSGRFSEAIFSLRRSLAMAPGFSGARMELARAYYEAGNASLARPLFAQLLDENPPAGVEGVIRDYLSVIDRQPVSPGVSFSPFLEGAVGYDTNANGSTDNRQFLGFVLSDQNVEADSPYAEIGAGFDWIKPTQGGINWLARLRGNHRSNRDASYIDTTFLSGLVGLAWQRGGFYGNAALDTYWAARDGKSNEDYTGISLLLGRRISDNWDAVSDFSTGALRFNDTLDVMDVDRWLLGVGLVRRLGSGGSLRLQLIGGSDSERQSNSPYGNSKLGGRIALALPVNSRVSVNAFLGSLETEYDRPFFGVEREDTQLTAALEIVWQNITPGLSLVPAIRWIDNDSSLSLYTYDRTEISLNLRWIPR